MDTSYFLEVSMRYGHSNFVFATFEEAKAIHDRIAPLIGEKFSNDPDKRRVTFESGDGIGTVDPSEISAIRVVDKAKFRELATWEDEAMLKFRAQADEFLAKAIAAALEGYARARRE